MACWGITGAYDIIVKLKAGNPRNLPRANMTYRESGFLESFGHSYGPSAKLAHCVVVLSVSAWCKYCFGCTVRGKMSWGALSICPLELDRSGWCLRRGGTQWWQKLQITGFRPVLHTANAAHAGCVGSDSTKNRALLSWPREQDFTISAWEEVKRVHTLFGDVQNLVAFFTAMPGFCTQMLSEEPKLKRGRLKVF